MKDIEYTVKEALKIAPKECWASEYTEDEKLYAISTLIQKEREEVLLGFLNWSFKDEGLNRDDWYEHTYKHIKEKIKSYLSQTKGGKK